ncbi:MAG: macro domain-containing protein [Cyanobacteriota bacterium]|jgi:O-acetyl-ADP-ribose deacetylase (regulator of RNase III)
MNQIARRRTYRFAASTLALEFADILSSDAEVLVSSDDGYLSMGGGVSRALRLAGGNAIALDAAKMIPAAVGDVVVTTAGALQAHYIFHAITLGPGAEATTPQATLERTTRRCMQLVAALGVTSIAFPAIGAGRAGFSYEDVAVSMAAVIAEELGRAPCAVEVAIHLFDPNDQDRFDPFAFAEAFARHESQWQAVPPPPPASPERTVGTDVFISYSHKDQKWLKLLQVFLQPLVRKGALSLWDDTKIDPGTKWREAIETALRSSKVAVLLVSKDFLASPFIAEHELPTLLAAAESRGLTIIWVYLSPCLYQESGVGAYQAAHDTSRTISSLRGAKREEVLVNICQKIKAALSA